jgi:hypothetical protein
MQSYIFSRDLIFITRVREVATHAGASLVVVKNPALLAELELVVSDSLSSGVIFIDLDRNPFELPVIAPVVERALSSGKWRCITYYSHVERELGELARSYRLGEVVPRSRFVMLLPEVFSR